MTNEKSLFSSQSYEIKTLNIFSNIVDSVLSSFDSNSSEGLLNHVSIVKACMIGITLLGHISTQFERKRKNNLLILRLGFSQYLVFTIQSGMLKKNRFHLSSYRLTVEIRLFQSSEMEVLQAHRTHEIFLLAFIHKIE